MPFWFFLWAYGLFVQPQPAYQLQYQQQLLNATPQVINIGPGNITGTTPPQVIYMPPCRWLTPTLGVCS